MADVNQIINYIMSTPTNTNWNVLSTLLGVGDWSKLKAYVEKTPHNMNRKVLEALLNGNTAISKSITASLSFDYDPEGVRPVYIVQMSSTNVDTDIWNFLEQNSNYNITATFASGLTSTITTTVQANQNSKGLNITDVFEETNNSVYLVFVNQNDVITVSGNGSITASSTLPSDTFGDSVVFTFTKVQNNGAVVGTAVVGRDTVG